MTQSAQQILEALTTALQGLTLPSTSPNLHFEQFNENEETFPSYSKRLENYLALKNITDATKKRQVLINCMGAKYYQLLSNLTAPEEPEAKSYDQLIEILKDHLSPKPNQITEQHKFLLRLQHEGESIANYLADLKKNERVLSQFIRGLRDSDIKERLLQETTKIKLEETVQSALAMEASKLESRAMHNVHQLQFKTMTQKNTSHKSNNNTHRVNNSKYTRNNKIICYRCGRQNHMANNCKANNLHCTICRRKGHVSNVCIRSRTSTRETNTLEITQGAADNMHEINVIDLMEDGKQSIHSVQLHQKLVSNSGRGKYFVSLKINGKPFEMEFDTGAAISVTNYETFKLHWPKVRILPTDVKLKTYNHEILPAYGKSEVQVQYNNQIVNCDLYIVKGKFDTIMGREWVHKLQLLSVNAIDVYTERDISNLKEQLFKNYANVFRQEIGNIPNVKGMLKLRDGATPTFMKARSVPYAIRPLIENELDRLEECGIIQKIAHSDWGTPVVPVIKADKSIRLCADYKTTLNKYLVNDGYPMHKIEDLFQKLKNGEYYCTFDIYKAYLHLQMTEDSSLMQTISTIKGLYKVNKLMFGLKTAANIWQRFMDENITNDLERTACFIDNIIVVAKSISELFHRCAELLNKLQKFDLHLNKSKCKLFEKSVTYLGHKIDKEGLHKTSEKVEAISKIQPPTDINQLRHFLGMVNYYHKFIPYLSTKLHPLYHLLRKDQKFVWGDECQHAFEVIKKEMMSDKVLIPFNADLPLILATDASPVGLSAILSHRTKDGERPIAFASRSLTKSETNYSQLDKEATAIYWGLHKFFNNCYGREFTLMTDNRPLITIFHPNKNLPLLTAQRLLHYAQFLSGFNYNIQHKSSKDNINADFLSRNPITSEDSRSGDETYEIFQIWDECLPLTNLEITKETKRDKELSSLWILLQTGASLNNTSYKHMESELMIHEGCIYRGLLILIPCSLRTRVLNELHAAHIGIVKMKSLARSYCYWTGIDRDIEELVKSCRDCAKVLKEPNKMSSHPWEIPAQPWQRLHIDFAGPFMEKYFFIVVDAKTKWLEVFPMNRITSFYTIRAMRELFARFSIPQTIVSDNGTNFTSKEFRDFLKSNNICFKLTAPAHPSTNGQAERFIQILKNGLRSATNDPGDLHVKLQRLLMQYRKTESSTTHKSPAEMMLKFNLRTRMDLLHYMNPDQTKEIEDCKRSFGIGDLVQVRYYQNKECKWKFGRVSDRVGHLHYIVDVDGVPFRRHIDQMRSTNVEGNAPGYIPKSLPLGPQTNINSEKTEGPTVTVEELRKETPAAVSQEPATETTSTYSTLEPHFPPKLATANKAEDEEPNQLEPRRSSRIRRPVIPYQHKP